MKKIIAKIFIVFALLISFISTSANAAITSDYDLTYKRSQLQTIINTDFLSFINKTELIGYNLSNFNMHSSQYKYQINLAIEKLNGCANQIDFIRESKEISDSDKNIKINQVYMDANSALYEIDSKTINYIYTVREAMPTITYQKYIKKFTEFYNSIQLTESMINLQ